MCDKVDEFYSELVEKYKTNRNRLEIINLVKTYCEDNTERCIYLLKKKLEVDFSNDVNCQYLYLKTPDNYGCDLRELFFKRNGELINDDGQDALIQRQELLQLFKEKRYLPNGKKIPHILTDIDDTLYPNHAAGIAGSDLSWFLHEHYPGIIRFYELFYSNISDEEFRYSTVLSATPGPLKSSKLKDKKRSIKNVLGDKYGFIQGEESKLKQLFNTGNRFQLYGDIKYQRYKEYCLLFPEHQIIFIGDNGQGDLMAGEKMMANLKTDTNEHDTMVFIHEIIESSGLKNSRKEGKEDLLSIRFFKNYLELGKIFLGLGLIIQENIDDLKETIIGELQNNIHKICDKRDILSCKKNKKYLEMFNHYLCCDKDIRNCFKDPLCINEFELTLKDGGKKRTNKKKKKNRKTKKQRKLNNLLPP